MVEESLDEIKWLLVDAASTYLHKTRTNSPNLDQELCIFLKTEEGKSEMMYAPLIAHQHTLRLGCWGGRHVEDGKDSEKQSW